MPVISFVLQIGTLVQPMFLSKGNAFEMLKMNWPEAKKSVKMKHKRGFEFYKKEV